MMPAVLRFLPMLSAPSPQKTDSKHRPRISQTAQNPVFAALVGCAMGCILANSHREHQSSHGQKARSSAVRRHILRPLRRGCQLRPVVSSGQILRIIVIMRNIEHPRLFCAPFPKKNHAGGIAYFAQLPIWCMVCTSCYGLPAPVCRWCEHHGPATIANLRTTTARRFCKSLPTRRKGGLTWFLRIYHTRRRCPALRIIPRRPHEGLTSVRFRRPPAVLSRIRINQAVCSAP